MNHGLVFPRTTPGFSANSCDLISQTCVPDICHVDVANGYIVDKPNNVGDNNTLVCFPGFLDNINNSSRVNVSCHSSGEWRNNKREVTCTPKFRLKYL